MVAKKSKVVAKKTPGKKVKKVAHAKKIHFARRFAIILAIIVGILFIAFVYKNYL